MDTSSQNWYPLVLLQIHFINTTMLERFILYIKWKSLTNRIFFFKVKWFKLVITRWKLLNSKVYHGLNNTLGIWVHEKYYQVLPTQMVPICENLGLGPWTKLLNFWVLQIYPVCYQLLIYIYVYCMIFIYESNEHCSKCASTDFPKVHMVVLALNGS